MTRIAYALYDVHEMELHLFSAPSHILAKDAVKEYMTQNILPTSFHNGLEDENVIDLLKEIAQSNGIEKLIGVLEQWDYTLKTLFV
ncbi:hypothetical protein [Kosakonia sacchari]|uniref:hypothetical protein n=1 Tax=Kosakonia sacchari TaxID=1158459 RepID=UPI001585B904|nr:hypothetical protein [Kosakonia sacchari]NUL35083.1 hypothetical protein [Kosakonia sacchari]